MRLPAVLGVFAFAQLADVLTTAYGQAHGLLEVNPIAAYLMMFGGVWILAAWKAWSVCAVAVGMKFSLRARDAFVWVAVFGAIFVGLTALWNVAEIRG